MRVYLKHIHTVRRRLADGSVREHHYHRITRKPIEGTPGTPEFLESYKRAATSHGKTGDRLRDLVSLFLASPEYSTLAPSTRRAYRQCLGRLCEEFGDMPIAALNDRRVRGDFLAWRDAIARTAPRSADMHIVATQRLLSWAHNRGLIQHNHLMRPGRLYRAQRSDMIWTDEHIRAFREVAPLELQLALDLALESAQRQGDLLRLPWSSYDGAFLSLRQNKTGRLVRIPVTNRLKRILDDVPRRATTILTTARGKPWKPDHFRHAWSDVCRTAGIEGLHFHDLRGTAITRLSEAGCTPQEIATISGHSLQSVSHILDAYSARTLTLARSAVDKLEAAKGTEGRD